MKVINQKGFTLIELLVVIAIIGILSTLAVVSLNGARNKANDAKIKSDLNQIRDLVITSYDTGDISSIASITSVFTKAGVPALVPPTCASPTNYVIVTNTDKIGWAAYGDLCSETTYFCLDSNGFAGTTGTAPVSGATGGKCQ